MRHFVTIFLISFVQWSFTHIILGVCTNTNTITCMLAFNYFSYIILVYTHNVCISLALYAFMFSIEKQPFNYFNYIIFVYTHNVCISLAPYALCFPLKNKFVTRRSYVYVTIPLTLIIGYNFLGCNSY